MRKGRGVACSAMLRLTFICFTVNVLDEDKGCLMASGKTLVFTPNGLQEKETRYTLVGVGKKVQPTAPAGISLGSVVSLVQTTLVSLSVFSMALSLLLSRSGVITYNNAASTSNNDVIYGNYIMFGLFAVVFFVIFILYGLMGPDSPQWLWSIALSSFTTVVTLVFAVSILQEPEATAAASTITVGDEDYTQTHVLIGTWIAVVGFGVISLFFLQSGPKSQGDYSLLFSAYVVVFVISAAVLAMTNSRNSTSVGLALPPPAPPGMYYSDTSQITFETMVPGTVQSFDADMYKSEFVSVLPGINESNIELNVTAGSVRVGTTITTTNTSAANHAFVVLSSYNATWFSNALNLTIEWIGAPTLTTLLATWPSPPSHPPSSPPPHNASESGSGIVDSGSGETGSGSGGS